MESHRRAGRLPDRVRADGGGGRSGTAAAVVIVSATVVALAGLVALMAALEPTHAVGAHGAHEQAVYQAGGMDVSVYTWQWMSHDQVGGPTPAANNFPQPAQMMPGMQADDVNRLEVELTVTNRNDQEELLTSDDFQVESPAGQQWPVNSDSQTAVNVPAGMSMTLDLFFDVPLKETIKDMVFTKNGDFTQIPFGGPTPSHQHGY